MDESTIRNARDCFGLLSRDAMLEHDWWGQAREMTVQTDHLRRGEVAIAGAQLEALPNPSKQREYVIHFSFPEFTCKCPITGYPDFAVVDIWISPADSIIELKSLKLYLNRYRDSYGFHEEMTNRILDDVVAAANPRWARIVADWNPRGNLKTTVTAAHRPDHRPSTLSETPSSDGAQM